MLFPIHKNTVKKLIRRQGNFSGYIAPCNVSAFHIVGGWHIGMSVNFTSIEEMEKTIDEFAFYNCIPELGMRVRFWVNGSGKGL